MTYTPMGVAPKDAEFTALRVHQIREIARFFRIPVAMLGDLERSTFSNHEQQVLSYFTSCLRQWLTRVEEECTMKLIAPLERNSQLIEHVVEGFLRSDVEKRAAFYATMSSHGLMTPNEIRALENLPPIKGGDVARVPSNTEPLGESNAA
jgi:HK97 family phage portal protein